MQQPPGARQIPQQQVLKMPKMISATYVRQKEMHIEWADKIWGDGHSALVKNGRSAHMS